MPRKICSLPSPHRQRHDRVLDVHPVFGLVVDDGLGAVDDGVCDFDAAISREAVHVDGILFCQRHAALVTDPALVTLDHLYHLRIVFDRHQRPPTLGIDNVRANERLVHVMHDLETAAGLSGVVGGVVENFRHQIKLRRVRQHDISAKLREEFDHRLRQRERLGVRFGIGPGHDDLLAAQVVALFLDDSHKVGHRLAGMVDVALHVDHWHAGMFRDGAQVLVALAPIAVTDGDAVTIGREDFADLFGRVAMRNLRFAGIEEDGMAAQARHTGLERIARARGRKEKKHEERLVAQQARGQVETPLHFEIGGKLEDGFKLFFCPFLGTDEVSTT